MSNSTNISYLNSLLISNIRTTYLIDSLKMYLAIPISILGTALNAISIIILSTKSFRKINIFKIMKIYNIVSLVILFGSIFSFLLTPYILFELEREKNENKQKRDRDCRIKKA